MNARLRGDRVALRPATHADVPALATFFAVPEVAEWWPGENGFRDVGIMRRYERANDGTWRDSLLMDLLAEELQG